LEPCFFNLIVNWYENDVFENVDATICIF
jgi:hypothetical protein